jgi:hypothetical protein
MSINRYTIINQTKFIEYLSVKYKFNTDTEVANFKQQQDKSVIAHTPESILDINIIINTVEKQFDIPLGSLKSKSRKRDYVVPRSAIWHILHNKAPKIFTKKWLGRMFYRDHSDIIHGINTINDMIDTNDFKYISALEVVSKIIHDYAFEKEEMQRMSEGGLSMGKRNVSTLFCKGIQAQKSNIQSWQDREYIQV